MLGPQSEIAVAWREWPNSTYEQVTQLPITTEVSSSEGQEA